MDRPISNMERSRLALAEHRRTIPGNQNGLLCSSSFMASVYNRISGFNYAANDGLVTLQSAFALRHEILDIDPIYTTQQGPLVLKDPVWPVIPIALSDFSQRLPVAKDHVRIFANYNHDDMVIGKSEDNYALFQSVADDLNCAVGQVSTLGVTPQRLEVGWQQGETEFSIEASHPWTITCDAGWLELSQTDDSCRTTIHVAYEENGEDRAREATVRVLGNGTSPEFVNVTILQKEPLLLRITNTAYRRGCIISQTPITCDSEYTTHYRLQGNFIYGNVCEDAPEINRALWMLDYEDDPKVVFVQKEGKYYVAWGASDFWLTWYMPIGLYPPGEPGGVAPSVSGYKIRNDEGSVIYNFSGVTSSSVTYAAKTVSASIYTKRIVRGASAQSIGHAFLVHYNNHGGTYFATAPFGEVSCAPVSGIDESQKKWNIVKIEPYNTWPPGTTKNVYINYGGGDVVVGQVTDSTSFTFDSRTMRGGVNTDEEVITTNYKVNCPEISGGDEYANVDIWIDPPILDLGRGYVSPSFSPITVESLIYSTYNGYDTGLEISRYGETTVSIDSSVYSSSAVLKVY